MNAPGAGSGGILPQAPPGGLGFTKRWAGEAQVAWHAWRVGAPAQALVAGWGGMGDDLCYTALAREILRRTGRPAWILSRQPRLFAGNPAVPASFAPRPAALEALRRHGVRVHAPGYGRWADRGRPASLRHTIAMMAAEAGLSGEIELAPELRLTPAERAAGRVAARQVAVQSSTLGARFPSPNKQWPLERLEEVVRRLPAGLTAVQVGGAQDPLLPGAVDRRQRPDIRETAAIVAAAEAVIAPEGFMTHLARAVGTRAVVVYGGYTAPDETGYPCNENLYTAVPCAPCWEPRRCDFDRRCLTAIEPGHVLAALERVLARRGQPLETTRVRLEAPQAAPA